jgi:hypothetical protein
LLGGEVCKGEQAAALAEEGVGVFGDVPERLPACGRLGVEGCRLSLVAGVFGELGADGAEGVIVQRIPRLYGFDESTSEAWVIGPSALRTILARCLAKYVVSWVPADSSISPSRAVVLSGRAEAAARNPRTTMSAVPLSRAASTSHSAAAGVASCSPQATPHASSTDRTSMSRLVTPLVSSVAARRPARSIASSVRPSSARRPGQFAFVVPAWRGN